MQDKKMKILMKIVFITIVTLAVSIVYYKYLNDEVSLLLFIGIIIIGFIQIGLVIFVLSFAEIRENNIKNGGRLVNAIVKNIEKRKLYSQDGKNKYRYYVICEYNGKEFDSYGWKMIDNLDSIEVGSSIDLYINENYNEQSFKDKYLKGEHYVDVSRKLKTIK